MDPHSGWARVGDDRPICETDKGIVWRIEGQLRDSFGGGDPLLRVLGHETVKGVLDNPPCRGGRIRGRGEGGKELPLDPKRREEVEDDHGREVGGGLGEVEREDVEGVLDVDVYCLANAAKSLFSNLTLT